MLREGAQSLYPVDSHRQGMLVPIAVRIAGLGLPTDRMVHARGGTTVVKLRRVLCQFCGLLRVW